MHCSVIIPTWNEEMWLPRLLDCVSKHPLVHEIIIVDNNSTDGTIKIAENYNCRVARGSLPGLSRNIGAKIARSNILVFVDADTVIPKVTLSRAIHILSMTETVLYHCPIIPLTKLKYIRFVYWIMKWFFYSLQITPFKQGVGSFLAINRRAFFDLNGFSERIAVGEDLDLVRRIGKKGNIVYDTKAFVYTSPRRMHLENQITFSFKSILWSLIRFTPIKSSGFNYLWKKYPDNLFELEQLPYFD